MNDNVNKQVFILGAGSLVTPFLAQRLSQLNYHGLTLSRTPPPPHPPIPPDFPWQACDLEENNWQAETDSIIVSVMPLWITAKIIDRLLPAKQLIAFSSTSRFTKIHSPSHSERHIAQKLINAEDDIMEQCHKNHLPCTILRPTMIYGAGRDQNITRIAQFIRRWRFFPITYPGNGLRQPVHADDLAQATVSAIANRSAYYNCFNLTGGETLTYREMVARIFQLLELKPIITPVPIEILRKLPYFSRNTNIAQFLRMNENLAFDASDAKTILEFNPRVFLSLL